MSASCPACGFTNPGDAVYCGRCGGTLGHTCTACGFGPLPAGLVYCTSCGAELQSPEVALERKIVTVLFVDVVGFTALAERLDPEDVRRIIDPYYARVRQELERYGGTVEKFIGDAAMALFGAPVAHEDDAERAVRAAYAVREAVGSLHDGEGSTRLQVRVGIATGEAVVAVHARPDEGAAMAHGDVVNTAARIQTAAPVDGILVDERTYRGTRFQIDYRLGPQVQAKGKTKPVPVWEVVAPRGRTGTDRLHHPRPLVGRKHELDVLARLLDEVVTGEEPRLATLVGPPGIGKSRLVWELSRRVDLGSEMIFWRQGRCLPYGDGVAFWALAEIVKGHAGILATDPPETVEEKLRIAVEDVVPDANDARWIETHLAPLAGLTPAHELRGDHRTEAFAAWRRFFEAIAARSPLVLVFEDLHWGDDGLLQFVSGLLGERFWGPLLVIATCRPELRERETGWGTGRSSTTIEVEPLTDDETARLVSDLLEAPKLPPELRSALLTGAGGNPLYAEEYVRMLVDRGLLRTDGADVEVSEAALPLPESVQAIVAARLDALPADEKKLVQAAAVIGRAFWLGALAAIEEQPRWSVEHRLHELESTQLVRRERDSIVLSEPQFSFSHAVVRDVAYEQIPRPLRAARHSRAAHWLEALSPERSEDRSEMLAHHYLSALRYVPEAERGNDDLVEPARLALRDAGDRSLSLNAFAKAAGYYDGALALWPPTAPGRADLMLELGRSRVHAESGGEALLEEARDTFLADGRPEKAAEAMVLIGELQWMQGDPNAFRSLEDAAALLEDAPASHAKAYVLSNLAAFLMIGDENERAIDIGLEALQMAEGLGLAELRAHALDSIGRARARIGDPRGVENLEESIAIAVASNSLESVRGYANLGNAHVEAGELTRAFELYEQGRTAAGRFGDADRIRWFVAERVYECYWRGHWDEATRLADDVVAQAEEGFPTAFEHDARLIRSRIHLARDRSPAALEDSSRALELGRRAGYPDMVVPALALHARILEAAGRREEAGSLADELLSIWPERFPTSYWVADLAFALDGLGRSQRLLEAAEHARTSSRWLEAARAVAESDYGRAAEVYASIGSLPDELISRLAAVRQAVGLGHRAEAEAGLASLLPALEQLGARRYVEDGKLLLAAFVEPSL